MSINGKKNVKIYFFPWISGEGCLILGAAIVLIPLIILSLISQGLSWVLDSTVGPWLKAVQQGYLSFFLAPLILMISPKFLASNFGTKNVSEAEIQKFFESAKDYKMDTGIHTYANIIFAFVMLGIILLFYYKKGLKKGWFRWIPRYLLINILITIPLLTFVWDKFLLSFLSSRYQLKGNYNEIYATMKKQVIDTYISFIPMSIVVTVICFSLLILVERKLRRVNTDITKHDLNMYTIGTKN